MVGIAVLSSDVLFLFLFGEPSIFFAFCLKEIIYRHMELVFFDVLLCPTADFIC